MVFHRVGNPVTVEVVGLNVIGRIVLRVGTVKVLAAVVHAALVGVVGRGGGDPNVLRAVGDTDVDQVAPRGVFEVIVQTVSVVVKQVGAGLVGVGVVLNFVKVVHAVGVAVCNAWIGEPAKSPQQLLPVRQTIAVGVFVVIVAVIQRGRDGPGVHAFRVAERTVAVGDLRGCP